MISISIMRHIKFRYLAFLYLFSANIFVCCFAGIDEDKANNYVEFLSSLKNTHNVSSIAWHPDSKYIAAGGMSKIISIWDVEQKEIVMTIEHEVGGVGALAYSPNGAYLAVGRTFTRVIPEGYHINLYDADTGALIRNYIPPPAKKNQSNDVKVLAFSADSKLLAANAYGSLDVGVVYSVNTDDVVSKLEVFDRNNKAGQINTLSFSPDDKYLAVGGGRGSVYFWEKKDWSLSYSFLGNENGIYSLAFSPDGSFISIASKVSDIHIWKLPIPECIRTLKSDHVGYVRRLQYSPDGSLMISGGADKSIAIYDMNDQINKYILKDFSRVAHPFISPDGKYLAIATGANVELWQFHKQ